MVKAFDPQGRQDILDVDTRLMAILREPPDKTAVVLCLTNVSAAEIVLDLDEVSAAIGWTIHGRMILTRNAQLSPKPGEGTLVIGAYGVVWLLFERLD